MLLSSVLASFSFASDVAEPSGSIAGKTASAHFEVFSKVVPDSFEGAGEYRLRRAELESQLATMKGQKLKVFTPEIFAGMLEEGIRIAQLGLQIFEKLPTIAGQINEHLLNLESRIQSKNALISWWELVSLRRELDSYPENYWNEFKFDIHTVLQGADLLRQVFVAHEYTLRNSDSWRGVIQAWQNVPASNRHQYVYKVDACKDVLGELVKHKFEEERDESIARAVDFFRARLSVRDIGIRFDISHKKFCDNDPKDGFEKWLKGKVLNESMVFFNDGIFRIHDFVVKRELLASYVNASSELTEWIGFNESYSKMENTKFYEDRLSNGESIELQSDLTMSSVYAEVRAKVETVIQAALKETFEWLMTQ